MEVDTKSQEDFLDTFSLKSQRKHHARENTMLENDRVIGETPVNDFSCVTEEADFPHCFMYMAGAPLSHRRRRRLAAATKLTFGPVEA